MLRFDFVRSSRKRRKAGISTTIAVSVTTVTDSRGMTYSAEAAGDHGFLRCHVVRRWLAHDGRTQYSIVVCNETDQDAFADAYFPDLGGGRKRTIIASVVGPNSDFTTSVVLESIGPGGIPEVHVALTGGDINFTLAVPPLPLELSAADAADEDAGPTAHDEVETLRPVAVAARPAAYAPAPPAVISPMRPARPLMRPTAPAQTQSLPPVAPIVLTFTALLAVSGLVAMRPQIVSLTIPPTAPAQAVFPVSYRATGLGSAHYAVMGPDGQTVASGPLSLGDGSFQVAVPPRTAPATYLVRLRVTNPVVSAEAEDYIHVAAVPPPPKPVPHRAPPTPAPPLPPQIRSLAIDRATLAGGETLNVYYTVDATGGTISLLDPSTQITYDRVALSESGHASFVAPRTDAERFLTVVLSAKRGSASTESRIGVSVTPLDAPPPDTPAPVDPSKAAVAEPGLVEPAATALSAPASVRAGQPVRVGIRGGGAGLQLRFLDDGGNELARRELHAGESLADFVAPRVHAPMRCVFEATYPRGEGSETVLRSILVLP